ncbi:GlxA family transcriptional regulator [Pseudomonas sp. OTU5201]|uniref:GlxA family transcriptional regulator n=1 Tax=Pseudomonas sp. OTU5201 TaxID=3043850 RepID=UPI00313DFAC3
MSRRVAMLVFPGFQLLDAAGPIAAFEAAGGYAIQVVALEPGLVQSSVRVAWQAEQLPQLSDIDTLLVAGGDGVDQAMNDERLLDFVRRAVARQVRVASVCSGSLLLAAAGVLDGRSATTHWSRTGQFERQFPDVHLDADRIFVKEESVWTSAGISAGIDLAIAMIAEDHGHELARSVAQELVVYYRRPGGQSQFSALLTMQGSHDRFDVLLDYVRCHLAQRHSVEDLAAIACMSPRHFAREFRAKTGVTPAKAVERLRVEAARTALEDGANSVQRVATECGFGDVERMRRSFMRLLGVPPSSLRRSVNA